MADEKDVRISGEVVSFIEKELKRGVSEEVVKKKLLSVGHKEVVVNKHLVYVRHKKRGKVYTVLAAVIFVLLLIFFLNSYDTVQNPIKTLAVVKEPPTVVKDTPTKAVPRVYKDAVVYCENYTLSQRAGCELEVAHDNQLSDVRLDKLSIISAVRTGDANSCESLTGYSKDACIDAGRISTIINFDECENLKTPYIKEYCKSTLYFELVEKSKDTSYCDKILVPLGMSQTCKEVFS